MWRLVFAALLCAGLSACATPSVIPSFSNLGGGLSGDDSPKAEAVQSSEPAPAKEKEKSTLSNIWSNFSSPFSSGEAPAEKPAAQPGQATSSNPAEALRLVNDYRRSKGLQPLTLNPKTAEAATMQAKAMARSGQMSHTGEDGSDVGRRLQLTGYRYHVAAENVGAGQMSVAEIVEGWKNSPAHSANLLLADAKHMGIAYEYNPDSRLKRYWALVVAAP